MSQKFRRPSTARGARGDRDEGAVNVQVVVRARPLSYQEKHDTAPVVTKCLSERNEVQISGWKRAHPHKTYTFDKVFSEESSQEEVYTYVASSFVKEVLLGYNCTIFAYGQTGTGKTHTMEGARDMLIACRDLGVAWKDNRTAGVIPRAVRQVFDELQKLDKEYTVRVSHLELYNEELFDLLSPDSVDPAQNKPLRIFEDQQKGVLVNNLEEIIVHSAEEIFTVLKRSSDKRRTAETKLNEFSSRSHCIFSIVVHVKESSVEGEESIKVGRLNLVDLAGSENIGRSGARDQRAKEAGNINQSLLTLGRVITALVEHHPHIPYRDSKLTRLLSESLGGRAKTCVIATFSPSGLCMDETFNTLEYASRAKNIRNKPEVNEKLSQRAVIRDYTIQIATLKQELAAAREKDGVFLPLDKYEELQMRLKMQSEAASMVQTTLLEREKEVESLKILQEETQTKLDEKTEECEVLKTELAEVRETLRLTQIELASTRDELECTRAIVCEQQQTEKKLHVEGSQLKNSLLTSLDDVVGLWGKLARKQDVLETNEAAAHVLRDSLVEGISELTLNVDKFSRSHAEAEGRLRTAFASTVHQTKADTNRMMDAMEGLAKRVDEIVHEFDSQADATDQLALESRSTLKQSITDDSTKTKSLLHGLCARVSDCVEDLSKRLQTQNERVGSMCAHVDREISSLVGSARVFNARQIDGIKSLGAYVAEAAERQISHLRHKCEELERVREREAARTSGACDRLTDTLVKMVRDFANEEIESRANIVTSVKDSTTEAVADIENTQSGHDTRADTLKGLTTEWTDVFSSTATALTAETKERQKPLEETFRTIGSDWSAMERDVSEGTTGAEDTVDSMNDRVVSYTTEAHQLQEEEKTTRKSALSDVTRRVGGGKEAFSEGLAKHSADIEDAAGTWNGEVDRTKESLAQFGSHCENAAHSLENTTTRFISDTWKRDVSTGSTPPRRRPGDPPYPDTLSVTRGHEEIKEEFYANLREKRARENAQSPNGAEDVDADGENVACSAPTSNHSGGETYTSDIAKNKEENNVGMEETSVPVHNSNSNSNSGNTSERETLTAPTRTVPPTEEDSK
eukprot:Rmarinus@m.2701